MKVKEVPLGKNKKRFVDRKWYISPEKEVELMLLLNEEKNDVIKKRCEESLYEFLKEAWHIIEPSTILRTNWHLKSICNHLEAVTNEEITRLIINIPPRSSKSTIVSVMWPIWCWIKKPYLRFLTGSHAEKLATRDTLKSRRLMTHPWFTSKWGDVVKLTKDQSEKKRYENTATGHRIAFGVLSGITGEGGDIIILDDPHDAKSAMFSEKERLNTLAAYDQEVSTRLNDPNKSAIVIVMQRLHEDDLAGHVLDKGSWEHLRFPMNYEIEEPCITSLGNQDPRKEEGELLWPERFGKAWIKEQVKTLGTYGAAGQLQQRPVPASGGLFQLSWLRTYIEVPHHHEWLDVVQFWDTAQKADQISNCPWVCGTWIRTETGMYLIDVLREWMNYPDGKRAVFSLAEKYKPTAIVIEDKSTGSSLIQDLEEETMLSVIPFEPEGDKITRFSSETPAIEAGNVYLPIAAHWKPEFEKELKSFPLSKYMDQADMVSMALYWFRLHNSDIDLDALEEVYNKQVPNYSAQCEEYEDLYD